MGHKEPCISSESLRGKSHCEGDILGHVRTCAAVDILKITHKTAARGDAVAVVTYFISECNRKFADLAVTFAWI